MSAQVHCLVLITKNTKSSTNNFQDSKITGATNWTRERTNRAFSLTVSLTDQYMKELLQSTDEEEPLAST